MDIQSGAPLAQPLNFPLGTPFFPHYLARMNTHTLTDALFTDLLDPAVPLLEVCRRHALPIGHLHDILAGDRFQSAVRALNRAMQLRSQALAPERTERALATLDAIARQTPTSPSHTECVRRAAGALLRATQPPKEPKTRRGTAPVPPQTGEDTPSPEPTITETPVIGPEAQTLTALPDKSPRPMTDVEASNHQPQGAWDACHGRTASADR
jgi:hypothetical protein